MSEVHIQNAYGILQGNDYGGYTVPSKGLYPFQWNWDSCLTALGFSYFDEKRAWEEIQTLFAHQWEDGMVPHIVFHQHDDGYFPGPDIWQTKREVATSGITQPPVAGFVVRKLLERANDQQLARHNASSLLPRILAWHEWFYQCRDPQQEGLVAIIHPWESGRDNSIDWDSPLAAVPTKGIQPYTRRDTQHTKPQHRPTRAQYDRYIWLVQAFRNMGWDNAKLHNASPFQVVDPGFNAILVRSSRDLSVVAERIGEEEYAAAFARLATTGEAALNTLWSDTWQQYLCYDRVKGALIESPSVGGILPVLASTTHATQIARRLEALGGQCRYLIPSHDPQSTEFDSRRYWRGPVWLIVNYLVSLGLRQAEQTAIAQRIVSDSIALIEQSGFAEYYDPITASPCGGGSFTWTAAMVIEFLKTD